LLRDGDAEGGLGQAGIGVAVEGVGRKVRK